MLCLKRKEGQEIVIDRDIVVQVVEIGRGFVKLGITAPMHKSIHRREELDRYEKFAEGIPELGGES